MSGNVLYRRGLLNGGQRDYPNLNKEFQEASGVFLNKIFGSKLILKICIHQYPALM